MTEDELYEMSNYKSKTTGLPENINVWVRTEVVSHGHSKYRIKISKDKMKWSGTFTVGKNPTFIAGKDQTNLSNKEIKVIIDWVSNYSSLIINHIDGILDSGEFAYEIQKARNS